MLAVLFLREVETVPIRVDGVEFQMAPGLVLDLATTVNTSFREFPLKLEHIVDEELYIASPRGPVTRERGEHEVCAIADHPQPAWVQLLWVGTIGVCPTEAELVAVELLGDHRTRHAENRKGDLEHQAVLLGPVRLATRGLSGGAQRCPLRPRLGRDLVSAALHHEYQYSRNFPS